MYNKKLISFSLILLILIISVGIVSAEDNSTFPSQPNITDENPTINDKTFEDIQTQVNQADENDTIELNGAYISSGNEISINKSLTIQGKENAVIDANKSSRIFNVIKWDSTLTLKNLKFLNAITNDDDCGVISTYNLNLINCTFINNDGNYIISYQRFLVLNDCHFENNVADYLIRGENNYGHATIDNSCFLNNNASAYYVLNGDGEIFNSSFENNTAYQSLIFIDNYFGYSEFIIDNVNFINNNLYTSDLISIQSGQASISNSNFSDNNAYALYVYGRSSIINSTFENNCFAGTLGGNSKILNCQFINNANGALRLCKYISEFNDQPYLSDPSDTTIIDNSTFRFNNGCAIDTRNNLYLTKSIFENNTGNNAGAIMLNGAIATLNNCTLKNNSRYSIMATGRLLYDSIEALPEIIIDGKTYDSAILYDNLTGINWDTNFTFEYGIPIIINLTSHNPTEIKCELIYQDVFGEEHFTTIISKSNFINLTEFNLELGTCFLNIKTISGEGWYEKIMDNFHYIIKIIKASTNVTANVDNITFSEISTINITGDVNGTAIVKIDENITKTVSITEKTVVSVTFENIPGGKHNVSVVLSPANYNYNQSTYNTEFLVFKKQPSIDIVCDEKIFGTTLTVNITIENATGKIKVNGKEHDLLNGKASVELTDLVLGNNTITVTYGGDESYTNATAATTVDVYPKFNADLKAKALDIIVGNVATIVIEINANITGDVTVDGIKVAVKDGKATYNISNLKVGKHSVIVNFGGDKYFEESSTAVEFNVNKIHLSPNNDYFNKIPSNNPTYAINMPSDATGELTVTIGNKTFSKKLVKGTATVEATDLPVGTYDVDITYSGDDKYESITKTDRATVTVNPKIVSDKITNVLYASDGKYSVTVYGTDAKVARNISVTFKIDDIVFKTANTDLNGVATFEVTQKPGTYTVTAEALGTKTISQLTVNHLVILKTVKVKKSAKKLVLTATLNKVNGKYLKKKTVTFKFNGKKYTAKTNKKGVAKVTLKSKVLKKLKVGKTVKYQVTYLKDTVKKSVKIKK